MDPRSILRAARDRADLVRAVRRDLHRIPELAFAEQRTTEYVAAFLAERGIGFEPAACGTGGVAVVGEGEPAVLLRADLDALPVDEQTGLGFASEHPGRMHACGHDAHAAMLLAAADALSAGAVAPPGRTVLVFQPAEEGHGGCARLLADGLLERHPAASAAALHVWPGLPTGSVGLSPGPLMAGMDRLTLVFHGRGGHGALPHTTVDPVVMAAEAVLALQTLVSRRTDPLAAAVVTVGAIRGGTAANVIPERVELLATIRAFDPAVRQGLLAGVQAVGDGVAAAHGGRFTWSVDETYPVTRNDAAATGRLAPALADLLGPDAVRPGAPTLGAEDMGLVLDRVPGCYVQLGCAADPAAAAPLHNPRFDIDEACLPVGVAVLLTAACALADQGGVPAPGG